MHDWLFQRNTNKVFVHFRHLTVQKCPCSAVGQKLLDCVQLRRIQQNVRIHLFFGKSVFNDNVLVTVGFEKYYLFLSKLTYADAFFLRQTMLFVYAKHQFGGNKRQNVVIVVYCAVKNCDAQIHCVGVD